MTHHDHDKVAALIRVAKAIAGSDATFQEIRGPGAGDHSTAGFMKVLRARAKTEFGFDHAEKKICGRTSYAVDFYFTDQATIVEVALGLPNPSSEFEKDILKAIVAKEHGQAVERLVFIARAGGEKKCKQPGRTALKKWALEKHGIAIEVHDLPGEPRVRKRRKKIV
jgi:hypothetical protein